MQVFYSSKTTYIIIDTVPKDAKHTCKMHKSYTLIRFRKWKSHLLCQKNFFPI